MIYFGFVDGVVNAQRVTVFMVFFLAIMSPLYFHKDVLSKIREKGRSVPKLVDLSFDLAVIFCLVWYGAVITAVAYLFHFLLQNAAFEKIKSESI